MVKIRTEEDQEVNPFTLFMRELLNIYSQAVLARQLGVTETEISYVVNGKRLPTQNLIRKFRENFPEYYPAAMKAANKTLKIAMPFPLDNVGPNQETFILLLGLLWDEPVDDTFYALLTDYVKMQLRSRGVLNSNAT